MRPRTLVGAAFLLPWVVVFHVIWFAHGWSAFRPLCLVSGVLSGGGMELTGPMTVEASDQFHDFFVRWIGPDSVRRSGDHGIDVRPALRMIPTSYLWNITRQVAEQVAERRGVAGRGERKTSHCDFIDEMLMENGKASSRTWGWGYWPYNEIDDRTPLGEYLVYYHCTTRRPVC